MIPQNNFNNFVEDIEKNSSTYRNKTYKIDFKNKTISGYVDELEAVKQTIYSILSSERYEYLIYSFDYGVELQDLIGEDMLYVKADIHRRVEEALKQDDRVVSVDNPQITAEGDCLYYRVTVTTIYGAIEVKKEVAY